jgi:diguanylate cyclase (GGDEF)-like protein
VKLPKYKNFRQFWQRSLLNHHIGIAIGLIVAGGLTIWQQIQVQIARNSVNHTFEVLEEIHDQQSLLLRLEFALQNYLSENSNLALTDYKSTQLEIITELESLKQLTYDNPIQQKKLDDYQSLLKNRFQQLEVTFAPQQLPQQTKENIDLIDELNSPFSFDLLYEQLISIEFLEKDLLAQRRLQVNQHGITMTATVLSGLFLVGFLSWQINKERKNQLNKEQILNARLRFIEIEQELSNHLLTCRNKQEAYEILHSFFNYLLPTSSGAILEINNSRDLLQPTVIVGEFPAVEFCTPKDCWALRQGQPPSGSHKNFIVPCQLCKKIYSDNIPQEMLCLPLQAHEQTLGVLHLTDTEKIGRDFLANLASQIALPLAVLYLQAELENQTFRDSNTGLWNRRFMDASIQRIFARAKRLNHDSQAQHSVGVIFCDIDHFKAYNTEFGHEAGDMVLRTVAKFLMETCREDDLPCRYGGEEFVLIILDTFLEGAEIKAERIREGVKQLPAPGNRVISLSLGVAAYPEHGTTPEEVLKAANLAMLKAKAEGRDRTLLA